MAKLPRGRVVERAAVNAARSFFERHGLVVQEIDGNNDLGEDLYLDFADDGVRTGETVRVQVKGGLSYRAAAGYRVRVGSHESDWADGNVPVLCVVHDPVTGSLYWGNATEQIHAARRRRESLRSVVVPADAVLDDASCAVFARMVRHYVGRYRGHRAIEARLAEMCGLSIGPADWAGHYRNIHGEDLVFVQRPDQPFALLLHSDLDWDVYEVTPAMLELDGLRDAVIDRGYDPRSAVLSGFAGVPVIGDIILESSEAVWLIACFGATMWMRADGAPQLAEPVEYRADERSGFPVVDVGRRVTNDDVAIATDEDA